MSLFGLGTCTAQADNSSLEKDSNRKLTDSLSPYEKEILSRVLRERGLELDPEPGSKRIEGIDVEPLDVFEPEDPLPGWVNWFHATSREDVIAREVLLHAGQRYSRSLAEESARNLRNLRQLSLVLVIPVKSADRSYVRLLVITKDVWSLRLNQAYRLKNGTFEYLSLQPSEENLFGRHLRIAAQYIYDISTNTFGGTISHQRIAGSRIGIAASTNVITNRGSGHIEGTAGTFGFGQPLFSSQTEWAWGTSLVWSQRIVRYLLPSADGQYVPRRFDDPSTKENENIPYRFQSRQLGWQTYVTRSYGRATKFNVSFGLESIQQKSDAHNLIADGYNPAAVARFESQALERTNVRLGPFVQVETYRNRYISLYDVETLGLQEDFRIGPRAFIKAYSGAKRAMSSRDLVGFSSGVDYTATLGGSLGRIWAMHTAEISPEPQDSDGLVQSGLRLVSPPLGLGRFVFDNGFTYRYKDYRNVRYALGGDNRLRGYPSQQFLGRNLVVSNLEFRTRSVRLFEVLFGLAGFYDIGDAFDNLSKFSPKHSVGIGARATAPQIERIAARLDVAFPLTAPRSTIGEHWGGIDVLFVLDGQAFPFPTSRPSSSRSPLVAAD